MNMYASHSGSKVLTAYSKEVCCMLLAVSMPLALHLHAMAGPTETELWTLIASIYHMSN